MGRRPKEITIIYPQYNQYQIIDRAITHLALEELSYEEFKLFMIFQLKDEVSLSELEHQHYQWGDPDESLYSIINRLILKGFLKKKEDNTDSVNYHQGKEYSLIPEESQTIKKENNTQ